MTEQQNLMKTYTDSNENAHILKGKHPLVLGETLWEQRSKRSVTDFDQYTNFINAKFGSNDNTNKSLAVSNNSTEAQIQGNLTTTLAAGNTTASNATANVSTAVVANVTVLTNLTSTNASSMSSSQNQINNLQEASNKSAIANETGNNVTNTLSQSFANKTAEIFKDLKSNETYSRTDLHSIVNDVLNENVKDDQEMDEIMKGVKTEEEKEENALG